MTDDLKYYKLVSIVDYVSDMTEGEAHMRNFAHAVNTGSTPDSKTMQFFADAFGKVLHDSKPDAIKKALKLGAGSGNRKSSEARAATANSKIRYAVMVEEYILQGHSKNKAYELVFNATDKSLDTIKRYHKDCSFEAKALLISFKVSEQQRSDTEKE